MSRALAAVREALPRRRPALRVEAGLTPFGHHTCQIESGYFPDGRLAEIFVHGLKSGPADALARDACILTSLALQYGAPLAALQKALQCGPDGSPTSVIGLILNIAAAIAPGGDAAAGAAPDAPAPKPGAPAAAALRGEAGLTPFGHHTCQIEAGHFPDGRLAEVFVHGLPSGPADALARDACILTSLALQYGAPLAALQKALQCGPDGSPASVIGLILNIAASIAPGGDAAAAPAPEAPAPKPGAPAAAALAGAAP